MGLRRWLYSSVFYLSLTSKSAVSERILNFSERSLFFVSERIHHYSSFLKLNFYFFVSVPFSCFFQWLIVVHRCCHHVLDAVALETGQESPRSRRNLHQKIYFSAVFSELKRIVGILCFSSDKSGTSWFTARRRVLPAPVTTSATRVTPSDPGKVFVILQIFHSSGWECCSSRSKQTSSTSKFTS